MSKYDKTTASTILYETRKIMEKEFYSHKLFKLSNKAAAEIVFKTMGEKYNTSITNDKQLKKTLNLNFPSFDIINFFQSSFFEIFKGINLINNEVSDKDISITVDEVLSLMASAYKLSLFKKFEAFHARDIVKLSAKKNGSLNFNYVNGHNVKYNITYDVFFRNLETNSIINDAKKNRLVSYYEVMKFSHERIFQMNVDIQFEGFNLDDYKIFTTFLNKIAIDELSNNFIIADQSGVISKRLDDWVRLISENTVLEKHVISNILNFLTFDFSKKSSYFRRKKSPFRNRFIGLQSLPRRFTSNRIKV